MTQGQLEATSAGLENRLRQICLFKAEDISSVSN